MEIKIAADGNKITFYADNGVWVLGTLELKPEEHTLVIKKLFCPAFVRGEFIEGELLRAAEDYAIDSGYERLTYEIYEPRDGNGYLRLFDSRGYVCENSRKATYLFHFTVDDILWNTRLERLLNMPLRTERQSVVAYETLGEMQKAQFAAIDSERCRQFDGFDTHLTSALLHNVTQAVIGKHYVSKRGSRIGIRRMVIEEDQRIYKSAAMLTGRFLRLFVGEPEGTLAKYQSNGDGYMIPLLSTNLRKSSYTVYDMYRSSKNIN